MGRGSRRHRRDRAPCSPGPRRGRARRLLRTGTPQPRARRAGLPSHRHRHNRALSRGRTRERQRLGLRGRRPRPGRKRTFPRTPTCESSPRTRPSISPSTCTRVSGISRIRRRTERPSPVCAWPSSPAAFSCSKRPARRPPLGILRPARVSIEAVGKFAPSIPSSGHGKVCAIVGFYPVRSEFVDRSFVLRLYSGTEMKASLLEAGFSSVSIFGGVDGCPYDQAASSLVALAIA